MEYLETIDLNFPSTDPEFFEEFAQFLGQTNFTAQPANTFPSIKLNQLGKRDLTVDFCTTKSCYSMPIKNMADAEWAGPYKYTLITLADFKTRLEGAKTHYVDHLGVNLPWQDSTELHPLIADLRTKLSDVALYHKFPSGNYWDFIIPGSVEEISRNSAIDYSIERRPKFEIVSFNNSSKPLVQFDVGIDMPIDEIANKFRDGIVLKDIKSVWVYLKSNYSFDVCLVLNPISSGWTRFFRDCRI